MSPRKTKYQRAVETADAFNQKHPQGTPVHFWPGIHQAAPLKSRTRGEAWALPSGEPVVRVEGRPGGIALSHIEVLAVLTESELVS
ncbi:hypothetical protein ACVWY0_001078 [Arthrobacter sp. UYNi723]